MRKNAFTWIEMAVVLFFLLVLAAILFPIFGRPRGSDASNGRGCPFNLKQIGLAITQYVQDYNSKYPLVNSGKEGWIDSLHPYLKSPHYFQCPSENLGIKDGTTDYFYNARLSGQDITKLNFVSNTLMNGDGAGNAGGNSSLKQLPPHWVSDIRSPANRHLEAANYCYADGHVKWLKAKFISNEKASATVSTFAP